MRTNGTFRILRKPRMFYYISWSLLNTSYLLKDVSKFIINRDNFSFIIFRKIFFLCLLPILSFSCSNGNNDRPLYFIGSSLVKHWDVRRYFPNRMTYNIGLSGSGIDYIELQNDRFKNEDVVIISGGNDIHSIIDVDSYAKHYVEVLQNMNANHIYLFAIFPRTAFEVDQYKKVRTLNKKIKEYIDGIGLTYITYLDLFEQLLINGRLNENLFYDGIHLNSQGYDFISKALNDVL